MRNKALRFGALFHVEQFGILLHAVDGDENVAADGFVLDEVESDDVGEGVVTQILLVEFGEVFVVAENDVDFANVFFVLVDEVG